jgi:hypothetical protein
MSLELIQRTLIRAFKDSFGNWIATRVAWENKAFTPPQAQPWMSFFFIPVDERILTLGAEGYDQIDGLVQIDLNQPSGTGEGATRKTINELRTCFKPRVLLYSGQSVTILSRTRGGGRITDGFFRIPFTVRWRSTLTRQT